MWTIESRACSMINMDVCMVFSSSVNPIKIDSSNYGDVVGGDHTTYCLPACSHITSHIPASKVITIVTFLVAAANRQWLSRLLLRSRSSIASSFSFHFWLFTGTTFRTGIWTTISILFSLFLALLIFLSWLLLLLVVVICSCGFGFAGGQPRWFSNVRGGACRLSCLTFCGLRFGC